MIRYIFKYVLRLFGFFKHSQTEPEITSTNIEYIGSEEMKFENMTTTISPIHKNSKTFFNIPEISEDKCCICLSSLDSKKTLKLSGCSHEIHIVCAKSWLFEKSECPLCRRDQNKLKKRLNI